jgi:hypothetical protein
MPTGSRPSDRSAERICAFAAFRAYSGAESLFFRYAMHWTPAGHVVMARNLDYFLGERYEAEWCQAR